MKGERQRIIYVTEKHQSAAFYMPSTGDGARIQGMCPDQESSQVLSVDVTRLSPLSYTGRAIPVYF